MGEGAGRPILVRGARLLDVTSGRLLTPGTLLIEGARITAVGVREVPGDALVIDLGDVTRLPGLWTWRLILSLMSPRTTQGVRPPWDMGFYYDHRRDQE